MIALLIKSSVVVACLLAFYKLVLEKESFFSKNRWYLIGCLILAFVLPFITLPQLVPDQGIVSTTIEKIAPAARSSEGASTEGAIMITDDLFEQSKTVEILYPTEETIVPTEEKTTEIQGNSTANTQATAKAPVIAKPTATESALGWSEWLLLIYFFGVLVFTLHLFTQIISLVLQIMKSTDRIEDTDCIIINMPGMKEPCSFFNYIFINPETYDYDTYEQILAHERIHVSQRHTIDLLLSELVAIVLWFNPLAWLFRKEVEKNLEYQTDDLLLRQKAAKKEVYQMNLVKIATHNKPLTVTTNYNQSLIKQRILKMNTQKSNPHSYWKYAFIAPMIFGILLILNKPNSVFAASDFDNGFSTKKIDFDKKEEATFVEKPATIVENRFDKKGKELVENISEKEAKIAILDNDKTACEKLEKAVQKSDIEEVKRILLNLDVNCFPGASENDAAIFETIKNAMSDYTEVFINPNSGQIILKYESTKIFDNNLKERPGFTGRRDFSKGFSIKCNDILKAEKERDFDTLKKLYKVLTADCLKNPTSENLQHMEYIKFLMNENANMSIETKTITLDTKEMMRIEKDKKSFNTSISSSDIEYNGSYMEMKNAGVFDKKQTTQTTYKTATKNNGCNDLLKAVSEQNIAELKKLVKYYNPNCSCESSETFRHNKNHTITITGNQTPMVNAARIGNVAIGKILVEGGADPDYHAAGEASPLKAATENRNKGFIKFLQKKESTSESIFGTSKKGKCKELINAIGIESIPEIKKLLKSVDVNCTCKNSDIYLQVEGGRYHESRSPLVTAARTGILEIGEILMSAGANVELHVRGDESALMAASASGNVDFVKLLVEKGADVNKKVKGDGTALLVASRQGHLAVVEYLISKRADVNGIVRGDGTPLIQAVRNNHYDVSEALLEAGAKPTLAVPGDENPVYHARVNNNRRMINLLIKYDK